MKKEKLALIALAFFFALTVVTLLHSISPYTTPSDLILSKGDIPNLQVVGKVEGVRNLGDHTEFYLSDGKARIKVIYNGSVGTEMQEAVVVGDWKQGALHAYKILRRCHTEYTG